MKTPARVSRRRFWRGGLVVAAVAVVMVATGSSAPAAGEPAAPTINSGPSGTVATGTASFTYSTPDLLITYRCSLDGAAFAGCSASGTTYTGLREGSHTFRVLVRSTLGVDGTAASRTWSVDKTAPTVTVTSPADGGSLDSASWSAACGGGGLCGTADDAVGVSEVSLALLQSSSGNYWNGSAFAATSAQYLVATGTTSWTYALAQPADGAYVLYVRAKDALNNQHTTYGASVSFSVVQSLLTPPVFTATPDDVVSTTTASFSFRLPAGPGLLTDDPNAVAGCALDGAAYQACTSPTALSGLAPGQHCFAVRAESPSGRTGDPTTYCWWTVVDAGFTVTGDVSASLYPGASAAIDLRITNPFAFDLRVASVTTTVSATTTRVGCSGTANLVVTRQFVGPVVVPAGTTRTLTQLGVASSAWPLVTMPNLSTNQDACKGAEFSLAHTGSGSKA